MQGPMDNLEPLAVRLGAGRVGLKRALEIVDHGQQLLHEIGCRHLHQIPAFAIDALAIVIELGSLAKQPIVKAVALFAQLDNFVDEHGGSVGCLRGCAFVVHPFHVRVFCRLGAS